jgi:hypothetical protein
MNTQEPTNSNSLSQSLFLIGRNSRGQWIVCHQCVTRGGLFINRAQALKFAMFENGRRLQLVNMVPGVLELDINSAVVNRKSDIRRPRRAHPAGHAEPTCEMPQYRTACMSTSCLLSD